MFKMFNVLLFRLDIQSLQVRSASQTSTVRKEPIFTELFVRTKALVFPSEFNPVTVFEDQLQV